MQYTKLVTGDLQDNLQFGDTHKQGDIYLCSSGELIDITNQIRIKKGYTDIVSVQMDNDVYYNFYLIFDLDKMEVAIHAVCNESEKDNGVEYELPMTEEEKISVLWQLAEMLAREICLA